MFGSTVLELAVGLIFVYLLLSMMCSAMAEILEGFLRKRASDLAHGFRELFGDSAGTGLVKQFYQHPLVAGFSQGPYEPGRTRNLPSYVPSRTFALTLLDLAIPKQQPAPSPIAGAGGTAAAPAPASAAVSLREAVATIPHTQLKGILAPLVESAENDYVKTVQAIENWYNASMERVGGWYKRRTQVIIFVIGLLLSIAINVDTLTVVKVLSHDPASRTKLAEAADTYSKSQSLKETDPKKNFENSIDSIERLGLPIGWNKNNPQLVPQEPYLWGLKAVGWFLTALAVSLGAPFWFDLLNKVTSVRAAIKPEGIKAAAGKPQESST